MASVVMFTPGEETSKNSHRLDLELDAFLEAFHLLEMGALPAEILKKIA